MTVSNIVENAIHWEVVAEKQTTEQFYRFPCLIKHWGDAYYRNGQIWDTMMRSPWKPLFLAMET